MKTLKTFISDTIITEHYNTAINSRTNDKQKMMDISHNVYDMIVASYAYLPDGLAGCSSYDDFVDQYINTTEELLWKYVTRNGRITAINIYTLKRGGRKGICCATDGTNQGKSDLAMVMDEDMTQEGREAWVEMSGAALGYFLKENVLVSKNGKISDLYVNEASTAQKLLHDKEVIPMSIYDKNDRYFYKRKIHGKWHTKLLCGITPLREEVKPDTGMRMALSEYNKKYSKEEA